MVDDRHFVFPDIFSAFSSEIFITVMLKVNISRIYTCFFFTSVCLSTGEDMHGRGRVWQAACMAGGMYGRKGMDCRRDDH